MFKVKWTLLTVLLSIWACDAYRLLVVFPMPSKSHGILGDNVIKHLLNAGHEVTYITPYPKKSGHPNLKYVDVSANGKICDENFLNVKNILDGVLDMKNNELLDTLMAEMTISTMQNENVQKLMRDPATKFDAVLAEYMFSELYSSFAPVFECPLIWISTIEPHWMITMLVDGPLNPAHTPDYLHNRVAPFTFTERVSELAQLIKGLYKKNFKLYTVQEDAYLRLIAPVIREKGRIPPYYDTVRYNASLVLGNTQVAIGDSVSLPQNYKHIGGYHIDEVTQPLPEDLKKILDDAKNGAIYFSLGSNLKSKDMPIELKQGLLKIFGELKQTVIWKFEEKLPNTPKNVHMVQWAPQQSILAHKNLILFITHGGLLSTTETVHFGVPIIAIPVFADQFINAKRAQRKGYGKEVDLTYKLHEDLKIALDEVLSHLETYTNKAQEISVAYHDQMQKPKDELNFWVNHVVRTRGAPHLRSIALDMPLYEKLYLDLLALILVALVVVTYSLRYVLCLITQKIKSKKEKRN